MKKKTVRTIGVGLLAAALLLPTSSAFASGNGHGDYVGDTNISSNYTDNSVNGLLNNILSGNILSNNKVSILNGNGIGLLGLGSAKNSGNTIQN